MVIPKCITYGAKIVCVVALVCMIVEIIVGFDERIGCSDTCNYTNIVKFIGNNMFWGDLFLTQAVWQMMMIARDHSNSGKIITDNHIVLFFVSALCAPIVGGIVSLVKFYGIESVCRMCFSEHAPYVMNWLIFRFSMAVIYIGVIIWCVIWRIWKYCVHSTGINMGSGGDEGIALIVQ